jgi:hypothetical protein
MDGGKKAGLETCRIKKIEGKINIELEIIMCTGSCILFSFPFLFGCHPCYLRCCV